MKRGGGEDSAAAVGGGAGGEGGDGAGWNSDFRVAGGAEDNMTLGRVVVEKGDQLVSNSFAFFYESALRSVRKRVVAFSGSGCLIGERLLRDNCLRCECSLYE